MNDHVYRNYDRNQFEWQYNARLQVKDNEAIVEDNIRRSEAFRAKAKCVLDLAYGKSERERLDIFFCEANNAPVHLFIHGGYWRSRDKSMFSFLAEPLVDAGALVVVVEYDLCPRVSMEEIVRQVRAAVSWLYRHATEHGGDPERLHVSGHSAGGHLAAMLGATRWPEIADGLPPDLLKSVTPISGLFTLEPLIRHSVNDDLKLDPDAARRTSPALTSPTVTGPVTVCVGGEESDEFRWQSQDFASRWKEHGADVTYVEVPDKNHFTILRDLGDPDFDLTRRLLRRMGLG
ncbi:MAG: alpha/beta hydrolase [Gammaproteobacteria bacterium]|nr:alpha/beta hydrolase [Gammaproteobacteria bacterium]